MISLVGKRLFCAALCVVSLGVNLTVFSSSAVWSNELNTHRWHGVELSLLLVLSNQMRLLHIRLLIQSAKQQGFYNLHWAGYNEEYRQMMFSAFEIDCCLQLGF